MLLTIAYHKGNKDFAQAQCDHIKNLCGKLPYPVLYVKDNVDSLDGAQELSSDVSEISVDLSPYKYPFVTCQAFKACALEAKRRNMNFLFIEPDVLILQPDFMAKLETELLMSGRLAVFTNNCWPPHDLVTGNGAYRSNTVDVWAPAISTTYGGWDGYAHANYSAHICRSPLIFHKYGEYDEKGFAHPFDLRKEDLSKAVIAHKIYSLGVYD